VNANVGQALMGKERYLEALPYLKKAIELRPQTVEAHYNLACCLAGMGDLEGAREELLTAKKLKSKLPEVKRLVNEALKEIDQALGE
jgi:Flp pilus assembly protein TadD